MKNYSKLDDENLAKKYAKYLKIMDKRPDIAERFENIASDLINKINARNRGYIFKAIIKYAKLPKAFQNKFEYAAHFADSLVYGTSDNEYLVTDASYEISTYYSKDKRPHVVCLVMNYIF